MIGRNSSLEKLEKGETPERYQRNIGTIGVAGQGKLLRGKVVIVGAGGLGGNIIELLARQGVGFIRVIDGDSFTIHNLNRQLLATEQNIGVNKSIAAVERIAIINSDIITEAIPQMLTKENAKELLADVDVVVDALDNIRDRLLLSQITRELGLPFVHGAIAGFTGQVTTLLPGDVGLERIYKKDSRGEKGIETQLGNPATTPALAAAIQCQEVVKLLTGIGEVLQNRLLYFDTEFNLFEVLTLK